MRKHQPHRRSRRRAVSRVDSERQISRRKPVSRVDSERQISRRKPVSRVDSERQISRRKRVRVVFWSRPNLISRGIKTEKTRASNFEVISSIGSSFVLALLRLGGFLPFSS